MKKLVYQVPETTICDICIRYPYLNHIGDGTGSGQEANRGNWDENRPAEDSDADEMNSAASTLWDE